MAADKASKREVLNVPIATRSKAVIESIREETGIPKTEAVARILEWFAGLDVKFQQAILLRDEKSRREFSRLALQQMSGEDTAGLAEAAEQFTVENAAAAIRSLVDQIETKHKAVRRELGEQVKGKGKS